MGDGAFGQQERYCVVCGVSYGKKRRHWYERRHCNRLKASLQRRRESVRRLDSLRRQLVPAPTNTQVARKTPFHCYFCDLKLEDETRPGMFVGYEYVSSTDVCSEEHWHIPTPILHFRQNAVEHLCSKEHHRSVHFFWRENMVHLSLKSTCRQDEEMFKPSDFFIANSLLAPVL